jgi:hypothetical protein
VKRQRKKQATEDDDARLLAVQNTYRMHPPKDKDKRDKHEEEKSTLGNPSQKSGRNTGLAPQSLRKTQPTEKSKTAQWSNSRRMASTSAPSSRKISRQQQQTAFAEGALPETSFPPQIALSKASSSE